MQDQISLEEFLAILRNEALQIDPQTAKVTFRWGDTADPYDVYPIERGAEYNTRLMYYARRPGSDICVAFCDLPEVTRDALWARLWPLNQRSLFGPDDDPSGCVW